MDKSAYILLIVLLVVFGITIYLATNIPTNSQSKPYNPVIDPYWAHGGRHYSGLLY
jgi:hypothetical protein